MDREAALAAFSRRLETAVAPLVPGDAAMAHLHSGARHRILKKGDHILRAGTVAEEVFFVHQGLLCYYFNDPNEGDKERTGQFFDEGFVVTDAESFLTRVPAEQNFEALETSSIVVLPRAVLQSGYDEDHAIERFGRLMLQEALIGSQRRASRLLTLQPEERYRRFIETRPEVARRVPQYLIASYLGLTPESLSRIRRRIAGKDL
ncbi:Crp/Fnr family transcriptional regulator [Aestuariibius insulae]|uniref:Crp/Fnr family transcriptional regulator n=1 Tax=Aestuariibius insulae TaxID=2058287 RepID=UPI00345EF01B